MKSKWIGWKKPLNEWQSEKNFSEHLLKLDGLKNLKKQLKVDKDKKKISTISRENSNKMVKNERIEF